MPFRAQQTGVTWLVTPSLTELLIVLIAGQDSAVIADRGARLAARTTDAPQPVCRAGVTPIPGGTIRGGQNGTACPHDRAGSDAWATYPIEFCCNARALRSPCLAIGRDHDGVSVTGGEAGSHTWATDPVESFRGAGRLCSPRSAMGGHDHAAIPHSEAGGRGRTTHTEELGGRRLLPTSGSLQKKGMSHLGSPGSSCAGSLSGIPRGRMAGTIACRFLVMAVSMENLQVGRTRVTRLADGLEMVDFKPVLRQEQ